MPRISPALVSAPILLALLALTGCSSGASISGGKDAGTEGSYCVVVPAQNPSLTFGDVVSVGEGSPPPQLQSLELVEPQHLRITGQWASPLVDGESALGGVQSENELNASEPWKARSDAAGFVAKQGSVNVMVQLEVTDGAQSGSAKALRVNYSSAGKQHSTDTGTAVELRLGKCD